MNAKAEATILAATLILTLGLDFSLTAKMDPEIQLGFETEVVRVIGEMASGPLKNRNLTIMADKDFSEGSRPSFWRDLLKSISSPITLIDPIPDAFEEQEGSLQVYHSVLIGLTKSDLWSSLWHPSEKWFPQGIVLFHGNKDCDVKNLLANAPLLDKSPSVVVFCPLATRNGRTPKERKVNFGIWTWNPFAATGQLVNMRVWDPSSFSNWRDLFLDRYQDFSKKTIVSYFSNTDEPVLFAKPDGSIDGTNHRILVELSKWLHFDFKYIPIAENSWVFMRDMVRNGTSDIMINYVTLTLDRAHEFDVSVPYQNEGFGMILRVPPPLPLWRNVYYPYSWKVWIAVVVTLVSTALTFHAINYRNEKSLVINFMVIAQCLMSHPIARVSEQWRQRLFLCIWDFMAWVLNLSYTCNLIAFLTIPLYPTLIQTVQELADSDYRVCMLDYGEFVPEALYASTHETLSALGDKLDMVPMRDDLVHWGQEGCIANTLANTHAHLETHYFVVILYSDLGHGEQVFPLKEEIYVGNLVFLFRKNTPWKDKINWGIRRLIEAGLVAKFYDDILSKYDKKKDDENLTILTPLTLEHLRGPFMMLLIGLGIATLVMSLEVILPQK